MAMDTQLKEQWADEMAKYPELVREALKAAVKKSHDLSQTNQKYPIRDKVIEQIRSLLSPDGLPNDHLVTEIAEWDVPE
jgi:hypothetical protein